LNQTSAKDARTLILSSDMPMLVTLFHNTVDNSAEVIVTKCLDSTLDAQSAVVTCQLLSLISLLLPVTTAQKEKPLETKFRT
jgi:hypothetical protein